MLDVGMRVGNASPTSLRGNEKALRDEIKAAEKQKQKDRARRMAMNPNLTEDDDEERNDPVLSHVMLMKDWRFCIISSDSDDGWEFRTGVEFLIDLENGLLNESVLFAQVWFPTTKTTKSNKATSIPIWATLGKRSDPEIEILFLLIDFLRWRGIVEGTVPLLQRPGRGLRGRIGWASSATRVTRIEPVTIICKQISV